MEDTPTSPDATSKTKHRWRRRLIVLAWIVSLIALYYGIEDWRGHRAWTAYRQDYEARVATLDLQSYVPKEVPDSENFGSIPIARQWFTERNNTNFFYFKDHWTKARNLTPDVIPGERMPKGQRFQRSFEDLVAWQEAFATPESERKNSAKVIHSNKLDAASRAQAAPAVLAAMTDDDNVFEQMRAATNRPQVRYAIDYDLNNPWGILLPHLAQIKQTCLRLEIRACAELAEGQTDRAMDDLNLSFFLIDSVKPEPFVITFLVRAACLQVALQPVWEGLAEHRWTDAQLQQLQSRLGSCNFPADFQRVFRAERAFGVLTADIFRERGLGLLADFIDPYQQTFKDSQGPVLDRTTLNVLGRILPRGWFDYEKLHYCQEGDRMFSSIDVEAKRVYPGVLATNAQELPTIAGAFVHHTLLAALITPSARKMMLKAAAPQTAADEAATACALERYRLANGQFPESLQALVPRFMTNLPNDIFTGEPLKYRRLEDGRFVLYSIGWNEKDDGGVSGREAFAADEGDWVWEYPAP
jgi:hypothetical protein